MTTFNYLPERKADPVLVVRLRRGRLGYGLLASIRSIRSDTKVWTQLCCECFELLLERKRFH